jgi:hypothetical protein
VDDSAELLKIRERFKEKTAKKAPPRMK